MDGAAGADPCFPLLQWRMSEWRDCGSALQNRAALWIKSTFCWQLGLMSLKKIKAHFNTEANLAYWMKTLFLISYSMPLWQIVTPSSCQGWSLSYNIALSHFCQILHIYGDEMIHLHTTHVWRKCISMHSWHIICNQVLWGPRSEGWLLIVEEEPCSKQKTLCEMFSGQEV